MARSKRKSTFDDVMAMMRVGPVWLGPSLAALIFALGWFVMPGLLGEPSDKPQVGHLVGTVIRKVAPNAVNLGWLVRAISCLGSTKNNLLADVGVGAPSQARRPV